MKEYSLLEKEITAAFEALLAEYSGATCRKDRITLFSNEEKNDIVKLSVDPVEEKKAVADFLANGCGCEDDCYKQFTAEELIDKRAQFQKFSLNEKNCYLIGQLSSFSRNSEFATTARGTAKRKHQTFEYRINVDRPVCRETFLFYHGETIKRLKRLQKHLLEKGCHPTVHGNVGRKPVHSCEASTQEAVITFIINFAANHGLPDPGRDIRRGKDRLRILLPSIMSYTSVHQVYQECSNLSGGRAVGYSLFVEIWQNKLPYITFNNPRTDLCLTCENFKKQLNQIAAVLDEDKERKQVELHQEALNHLRHAQKERLYYRAHAHVAQKNCENFITPVEKTLSPNKANSRDVLMHYSWDFAQKIHYPFEDQQVGPIYFKSPRRAELFGVCCEGIPCQVNYLIDEADFLKKNANTVISLLDHFFNNYGLGEKSVYLTADNCVGQNKNNALIQYLMYRLLAGLHSSVELSFLVVGHTKFSPDGFFGLIKRFYRRSQVYTYDHLVKTIEMSSKNGHNICQIYRKSAEDQPEIVYRDWVSWLGKYFKSVPDITSYHHFKMNNTEPGKLIVKEALDSEEKTLDLIKKESQINQHNPFSGLPERIMPLGLSIEREWYLYDQIRMHIPNELDKDQTCPKPKTNKPSSKKQEVLS